MNLSVTMEKLKTSEIPTKDQHVTKKKTIEDDIASICTSTSDTSSLSIIQAQTYRYKYTPEMTDILFKFARDNMEVDKHEFMASWNALLKDEKIEIYSERLTKKNKGAFFLYDLS